MIVRKTILLVATAWRHITNDNYRKFKRFSKLILNEKNNSAFYILYHRCYHYENYPRPGRGLYPHKPFGAATIWNAPYHDYKTKNTNFWSVKANESNAFNKHILPLCDKEKVHFIIEAIEKIHEYYRGIRTWAVKTRVGLLVVYGNLLCAVSQKLRQINVLS
ncbi:MAG: hypothetical protein ABIO55_13440 [Ginsengibacter sp.]